MGFKAVVCQEEAKNIINIVVIGRVGSVAVKRVKSKHDARGVK